MGTEVQFEMFFPGNHLRSDVNDKAGSRGLLLNCENSTITNGNQFNGFSRRSASAIQIGPEKEELRQMILKQESIFRHQLKELHRLYKIQCDLMNENKSKHFSKSSSPLCTFQSSSFSSNDRSEQHIYNFPSGYPKSGRNPGSEARVLSESRESVSLVRPLFGLELPADEHTIEKQKLLRAGLPTVELLASTSSGNLGRSKESLQKRDLSASSRASFHERGMLNNLKNENPRIGNNGLYGRSLHGTILSNQFSSTQVELKSSEQQTSRKIFGVEICQRNHSGSQLSYQPQAILGQVSNTSTGSNTSFMESMQSPQFVQQGLLVWGPREGGSSYQMSTESLLINFHQFVGMNKMKTSESHGLAWDLSSATSANDYERRIGCSGNGKRLASHVDKSYSSGGVGSFNSNLVDNSASTKPAEPDMKHRLEVEQLAEKNVNARGSSLREFLDLNVCPIEEEACSTFCSKTSQVKPVRGDIDLEVPVQETDESPREGSAESKQGSSVILDDKLGEEDDGLLRVAAETLVNISSICADNVQEQIFPDKSEDMQSDILQWFAVIIVSSSPVDHPLSNGECAPQGMDSFEFATLNLAETKVEELSYEPHISEEVRENLSSGLPPKAHTRRGRQKKDFQRDVLPGLTSLSRNEVTEDLHIIDGLIKARGGASRTGQTPRNGANKGNKARGRAKKKSFVDNDQMNPQTARKPQKCQEPGIEEGALMGWGKRARRPKTQRCSGSIHPIPLKEVL